MRGTSLFPVVILFASLRCVAAQQPGDRVRLTLGSASSQRLLGTLLGEDADSFRVQLADSRAPVSVARGAVGRVEVSHGQRRAVVKGAAIGAGLGLIGGFVLSGVAASKSRSCGTPDLFEMCYMDWYGRAFRGGLIGGAVGGLLGAALGYGVRTERWDHVAVAPRGTGVALALRF